MQSGLKQWLEYQRQHNLGAIAGYADQRVLQLMSKGTEEEQAWVWDLIRRVRQQYPQADHWSVNSTPAKIRIGMREPNNLKGRPAFTLYWYGGEICCAVRKISDHRELLEAQGTRWRVSVSTCPTQSDVGNWLNSVDQILTDRHLPTQGMGLVPSDYHQAEQDEPVPIIDLPTTKPPLNQILFGPPGTGKTYATINLR